jgi:DNA-binding transcriptional LysR family regulator
MQVSGRLACSAMKPSGWAMDAPNLAAVDLNLLVAFEALLIERNVSRAARRVGLTQPSMSNALARLRALLDDELFIRMPREMRPTVRALEIAEHVSAALQQIRSALKPTARFEPASTVRKFTIGAADNVDFALGIGLPTICQAAPNAGFDIKAVIYAEALAMLDTGFLDIAVGLFRAVPKRFSCVSLYWERYVCVADSEHSGLVNGLTVESFLALPHLFVARDTAGMVDAALAERGLKRRIAVEVPYFAVVPHLLEGTELLAVVGERIGQRFAAMTKIKCHPLPLDVPAWNVSAIWPRQNDPDHGVAWLLTMLQRTSAILTG